MLGRLEERDEARPSGRVWAVADRAEVYSPLGHRFPLARPRDLRASPSFAIAGDTWHLDEVFLPINGELHYLWRAVDQNGVVLDILVQDRRNASAAKRFFKQLLAGLRYRPKRIITDGLRSYGVAQREILPDVRHRNSRHLNNRAENSHRPTRRRKRQMQRFKSSQQAQRFLASHSMMYGHFRPRRHLIRLAGSAGQCREDPLKLAGPAPAHEAM
jgi:transposase-like protein